MNPLFDRNAIHVKPLSERKNKLDIRRDRIDPESYEATLDEAASASVARAAAALLRVLQMHGAGSELHGVHLLGRHELDRALELRLGERNRHPAVEWQAGLGGFGAAARHGAEAQRSRHERVTLVGERDDE